MCNKTLRLIPVGTAKEVGRRIEPARWKANALEKAELEPEYGKE
jgi:hypothetical protein